MSQPIERDTFDDGTSKPPTPAELQAAHDDYTRTTPMTDTPKPLDLSRYGGIERETWTWTVNQTSPSFPVNRFLCAEPTSEHPAGYGVVQHTAYWDIPLEFRNLLADAPLLLAEVRRLREALAGSYNISPLFWHKASPMDQDEHASCLLGCYTITDNEHIWNPSPDRPHILRFPKRDDLRGFATVEEAKAYAEQHWQATIKKHLTRRVLGEEGGGR